MTSTIYKKKPCLETSLLLVSQLQHPSVLRVPHRPTSAMTGGCQSVPACTAVSPRSRWKVARRRLAAWIITDGRTASGSSGAWSQAGPRETETDRPTDLLARRSVVGPSEHTVGRNLALTQCCLQRQRSQVVALAL